MPLPQLDDGYTRIANEIIDHLAKIHLSPNEWRTLFALWRKTYGWNRVADRISITQFQRLTGLDRRHQVRTLHALARKNLITVTTISYIHTYRFQKNFDLWKLLPVAATVGSVASSGNAALPVAATETVASSGTHKRHYKDTNKRHCTGETPITPLFSFKEAPEKAKEAWALWPPERRGTLEQFSRSYAITILSAEEHGLLLKYIPEALLKSGQHHQYAHGYDRMFLNFKGWNASSSMPNRKDPDVKEQLVLKTCFDLIAKNSDGRTLRPDIRSSLQVSETEITDLESAILRAMHTARMRSSGDKKQTLYSDELAIIQKHLPDLAKLIINMGVIIDKTPIPEPAFKKITKTDIDSALSKTGTKFTVP